MADDVVAAEEIARRDSLVAANLFERDPEQIAGLVYPLPEDRTLSALLRDYDTQQTTNRKVRCAVCPTHTQHYRGFVGQLDDGSLALIGINCGEYRFGKGVWATMSAALKREQDEAYYRSRVEPAVRQIAIVYPLLQQWRQRLRKWFDFRDELRGEFPELFAELREAAVRQEGNLTRERMVTVTVVDENGTPRKDRVPQVQTYGRIPNAAAFASVIGDRRLLDAGECLRKANGIFAAKRDLKSLTEAFRALRDARSAVDEVEEYHRGSISNLSLGWWGTACEWYNSVGGPGRLRLRGRVLVQANDGFPIKLDIPEAAASESLYGEIIAAWPK